MSWPQYMNHDTPSLARKLIKLHNQDKNYIFANNNYFKGLYEIGHIRICGK